MYYQDVIEMNKTCENEIKKYKRFNYSNEKSKDIYYQNLSRKAWKIATEDMLNFII